MEEKIIKKYIGRVYSIRNESDDNIYIGSTIQKLSTRMSVHRCRFNYFKRTGDKKRYWCMSFNIFEKDNPYIELISEHENISKEELKKIEGEEIRKHTNCVNKRIAGRTMKEYVIDEKDKLKLYEIERRKTEKRKEYMKNYLKEYYEKHKKH